MQNVIASALRALKPCATVEDVLEAKEAVEAALRGEPDDTSSRAIKLTQGIGFRSVERSSKPLQVHRGHASRPELRDCLDLWKRLLSTYRMTCRTSPIGVTLPPKLEDRRDPHTHLAQQHLWTPQQKSIRMQRIQLRPESTSRGRTFRPGDPRGTIGTTSSTPSRALPA